jgi:hypothetical protein
MSNIQIWTVIPGQPEVLQIKKKLILQIIFPTNPHPTPCAFVQAFHLCLTNLKSLLKMTAQPNFEIH